MKFRNSHRKSQTATEYIIIVAVVIVIALVVVTLMGGFPGFGGSSSRKVSDYQLSNGDKVGISNYYFGDGYVLATLKSNHYDKLQIINVTIRNFSCTVNNTNISGTNTSAFILTLNVGQSSTINCTGPFNISFNYEGTPYFLANYIDSLTDAYLTALYLGKGGSGSSGEGGGSGGGFSYPCNNSATFHNGTGTISDPYQICNWAQLNNIKNNLSAYFVLLTDLDSSAYGYSGIGNNWVPIGNSTPQYYFSGNFNGNGSSISNLIIDPSLTQNIGLFGYSTGNISNIELSNINLVTSPGSSNVGGLVGTQNGGKITNCSLAGSVNGTSSVGGLVGYQNAGLISNSYVLGNIFGNSLPGIGNIGGIVGGSGPNANISNSYSIVNVFSGADNVGGLVGDYNGTIYNCHSSGNISGGSYVGGLAGRLNNNGKINNSYIITSDTVSASNNSAGGLLGQNNYGLVTNSSAKIMGVVSAVNDVAGGLVGHNLYGTIMKSSADVSGIISASHFFAGGLVGYNYRAIIDNCSSTLSGSASSLGYAGGFTSINTGGNISNSSNTVSGNITSTGYSGGFTGLLWQGLIVGSSSNLSGIVTATNTYAGGLAGYNLGGTATNFRTTISGVVSAYNYSGGLIGYISSGNVINSSVIISGNISAYLAAGGLSGYNMNGLIDTSSAVISGIVSATSVASVTGFYNNKITNSFAILENTAIVTAPNLVFFVRDSTWGAPTNSYMTVRNINYGNITFLTWNISSGAGNILSNILIDYNSVYVNGSQASLNKSANITLIGLPTFTNPKIYRDGIYVCNETTIPSCYNFTSLNAGTVRFNVSSWSNYSIKGD